MNTEPVRGCVEVLDHTTHVLSRSGEIKMADDLHAVRRCVSDVLLTGLALIFTMTRGDRDPTFEEMDAAVRAHVQALTKCSGDDEKRACPAVHEMRRIACRRLS